MMAKSRIEKLDPNGKVGCSRRVNLNAAIEEQANDANARARAAIQAPNKIIQIGFLTAKEDGWVDCTAA